MGFQPVGFAMKTKRCFHMGWMDLDLDEISLRAFPRSVDGGPGPRRYCAAPGSLQRQRRGGGAAPRGQCAGGRVQQERPGASVRTRLVRVLLGAWPPAWRWEFIDLSSTKVILLRQVSTSSMSRSEFFDVRSLNNLVIWNSFRSSSHFF